MFSVGFKASFTSRLAGINTDLIGNVYILNKHVSRNLHLLLKWLFCCTKLLAKIIPCKTRQYIPVARAAASASLFGIWHFQVCWIPMFPFVFPSSDFYITALFCSAVGIGLNLGTQQGTQAPYTIRYWWRLQHWNRGKVVDTGHKCIHKGIHKRCHKTLFEFPPSSAWQMLV